MLILSVVYNKPYLGTLALKDKFKKLLERTIGFLRKLSLISPTCTVDCEILETLNNILFSIGEDIKSR